MIAMLRGRAIERGEGRIVLDVGGVGYLLAATSSAIRLAVPDGEEVTLVTHLHVREDAMVLYGFATRDERVCFEALIGAHGVGPALALAILSVHTPSGLRRALLDDDVAALTLVPGVGKKTAARLLLDLKARLEVPDLEVLPAGGSVRADLGAALAGLGYQPDEVREVLRELPADGDVDSLLRDALKMLAAAR